MAIGQKEKTKTWAKCSSPTCPSCDSHTAGVASWCQWARRASPPKGAKGSQSGQPWYHLEHLRGNHEMKPALWRLVSMLPGTALSPAVRQQTHTSEQILKPYVVLLCNMCVWAKLVTVQSVQKSVEKGCWHISLSLWLSQLHCKTVWGTIFCCFLPCSSFFSFLCVHYIKKLSVACVGWL